MVNRAEELITQLEAEIVKRDARIADLEASKVAADDMFRSLGGEIYELNAKLAALKAQQRGGVVLPERAAENTGNWGQELQARARNETLDEVASLNPPGKWSSAPSWGAIHNVLRNYHLATAVDDEGGAYPLIDAISVAGDDVSSGISECEYLADAIYDALLNPPRKFRLGDTVRKTKGSQWSGRVVGFYSTEQTPDGYAVESFTEKGSVQIYPGSALEPCEEPGECVAVPDGCKFELGFDVLDKPFRFVDSKSHVPTIKIILPACAPEDMEAFDVRDKIAKSVCALLAQQGKED